MKENFLETAKAQLRASNVVFTAMITGVGIFSVIGIVLIRFNGKFLNDDNMDKTFLITASAIAAVCLISSVSLYKKRILKTASLSLTFNGKLTNYRSVLVAYLAICEGAALFSIICLLLTGNYWFLLIIGTMVLAMANKRPTKQRVANDLQLDSQEQQEL